MVLILPSQDVTVRTHCRERHRDAWVLLFPHNEEQQTSPNKKKTPPPISQHKNNITQAIRLYGTCGFKKVQNILRRYSTKSICILIHFMHLRIEGRDTVYSGTVRCMSEDQNYYVLEEGQNYDDLRL